MGHLAGKDVFEQLGDKLSGIGTFVRTVNNTQFATILKTLYTTEEAEFVQRMPFGLHEVNTIAKVTGFNSEKCRDILMRLADKGLVIDLELNGKEQFTPSPFLIGFFEFTLMRRGADLPKEEWSRLFHDYLGGLSQYHAAHWKPEMISPSRTLPHLEALGERRSEILDCDSAKRLLRSSDFHAVGTCACRHEHDHLGTRRCTFPIETCMSLGAPARYLVRHNMARSISLAEAEERVDEAWRIGLVLSTDNVRRDVGFLCLCCSCCCTLLQGITRWGWTGVVTSAPWVARIDTSRCTACNRCARACPVQAMTITPRAASGKGAPPEIDGGKCLGCGVCVHECRLRALGLEPRDRRSHLPDNIIERAFLANLEQGTLANFLFDNPNSRSHTFLRSLVTATTTPSAVRQAIRQIGIKSRFFAWLWDRVQVR